MDGRPRFAAWLSSSASDAHELDPVKPTHSRAERVIAFIETLKITSGVKAGENFRLRDWQKAIVRGIYDPAGEDEIAIIDCRLQHGGNPILSWNMANCVVEIDPSGARKLSKSRSVERVDGAVALCMAIGLHSRNGQAELDFDRPLVLSA